MLVEKVLQLSMFSKNENKTINFRNLDLHEVVDVVVQTLKLKVEQSGGVLETDLGAEQNCVLADEMHITNVLFNLLDNAMKYSSEERSLHLKITTSNLDDGKSLLLSIEDNGIGIAKEDLKKIFDRFFRVQKGNVHNVKGFGLGLSYVQMIIHKHRGTIAAESELGKGTKCKLCINLRDLKFNNQNLYDSTFLSYSYEQKKNIAFRDLDRFTSLTPSIDELNKCNSHFYNQLNGLEEENDDSHDSNVNEDDDIIIVNN